MFAGEWSETESVAPGEGEGGQGVPQGEGHVKEMQRKQEEE